MAKIELLESEEHLDIAVEVGFENALGSTDTVQVLQVILEVLNSPLGAEFSEGLASLEIDQRSLSVRLRYPPSESKKPRQGESFSENMPMLRSQFLFYLFAKVDQRYRLGDIPFPPDFRYFLNFEDNLRKYHGWNLPQELDS